MVEVQQVVANLFVRNFSPFGIWNWHSISLGITLSMSATEDKGKKDRGQKER